MSKKKLNPGFFATVTEIFSLFFLITPQKRKTLLEWFIKNKCAMVFLI